jgi:hypothetical protein
MEKILGFAVSASDNCIKHKPENKKIYFGISEAMVLPLQMSLCDRWMKQTASKE